MNLQLKRIWSDDTGTFGVLMGADGPFAVTVELPWLNNEPRVSCIPVGTYVCKAVNSPKFGHTYEITGVPNRSHVLFHKANTINDLLGCIGVAEAFNVVGGIPGVTESAKGFQEFMALQKPIREFSLTITE
jgi:hypothetical protein